MVATHATHESLDAEAESSPGGPRYGRGGGPSWLRTVAIIVGVLIGLVLALGAVLTVFLIAGDSEPTASEPVATAADPTDSASGEPHDPIDAGTGTVEEPADEVSEPESTGEDDFIAENGDEGMRGFTLADDPLTLRGLGGIEYGMTVREAEAAVGFPLVRDEAWPERDPCQYLTVLGDPGSPLIMVHAPGGALADGTVVRIDAVGQQTLSGIGEGSTTDDVLAAYGERIVASPHPYGAGPGDQYLTYVPADAADADFRLIIETLDNVVVGVRSGLVPFVDQIEGCS